MLKEVYIIRNGVNIYHYSKKNDVTVDNFVLTSGLLLAIQQFTHETRSSSIDFFASKDEIFIYDIIDDLTLVCIFENNIQQTVAREVIHVIKEEIKYLSLDNLQANIVLDKKRTTKLNKKIEDIATRLISVDYQVIAAREIFDEMPDLSVLIIYDYSKNKTHFYDSMLDKQIEKKEILKALRSMQRCMMKLVKGLSIGTNYKFILINGSNFIITISKYKSILNLGYSKKPKSAKEIIEIPFMIMSLPEFNDYSKNFEDLSIKSRWKLNTNGNLLTLKGQTPFWNASDDLQSLMVSIKKLVEAVNERDFDDFTLYIEDPKYRYLKIMANFTAEDQLIDIY